jgi:hypothetical protein
MKSLFNKDVVDKILYDDVTKDVYIIGNYSDFDNKKLAVSFNEITTSFVSFYSYGKLFKLANLNGISYGLSAGDSSTGNIWKMYLGDYGKFFDEEVGYHLTYIVNPSSKDKTFTNALFNGTVW